MNHNSQKNIQKVLLIFILIMTTLACNMPTQSAPPAPEVPPEPATLPVPLEQEAEPENVTEAEPPEQPSAEEPDVCFEDVCLSFDESIACQVNGEIVPASDGEMWDNYPEYIKFTFDCYPLANTFHEAEIRIYPVNDYRARSDVIGSIVDDMNFLQDNRPPDPERIPFLPMWNAASMFKSKVQYLDFQNGSGVRFLTQFGQAAWPINNNDMFYTFQGMTADDQYYIAAILPASNPVLPDNGDDAVPGGDHMAFSENFENYVRDIKVQLDEQPDDSFTPGLCMLDEMIRSLRVH